jgi:hypothetical protein
VVLGIGLPSVALGLGACTSSRTGSSGRTTTTDTPLASRSGRVEVRVDGSAARARRARYLAGMVAAVTPVEALWGGGSVPKWVSVTAPATVAEFTELTGSASERVPALTRRDGRVVIHPDLWARTSAPGRQVVLTHELTHVALGQGAWAQSPRWVVEGSAELTAYRRTGLSAARIAPGVARRVRADQAPSGPPSDAEVAAADGYGLAWAWCRYLVSREGEEAFVRFVRRAGEDPTTAGTRRAFWATYGTDPERFATGYSTWLASWV